MPADAALVLPVPQTWVPAFVRLGLSHKAYGWRGIKGHGYTYVASNGYTPGEEQREYLYDDIHDPYQLNPREIKRECREEICRLRLRLREYLELTGNPFLGTVKLIHFEG